MKIDLKISHVDIYVVGAAGGLSEDRLILLVELHDGGRLLCGHESTNSPSQQHAMCWPTACNVLIDSSRLKIHQIYSIDPALRANLPDKIRLWGPICPIKSGSQSRIYSIDPALRANLPDKIRL